MSPCIECGKPTAWVLEPQYKRPRDPETVPFPCCPACSNQGRWKRRNWTMWAFEDEKDEA